MTSEFGEDSGRIVSARHRPWRRSARHVSRFAAAAALVCAVAIGHPVSAAPTAEYLRDNLIVKLAPVAGSPQAVKAGTSGRAGFDRLVGDLGIGTSTQMFPSQNVPPRLRALAAKLHLADFVRLAVPAGADPDAVRTRLESSPDVESAEFNGLMRIAGVAVTPDDPYFATHQYPLRNTGTQPPYDPGTAGADAEMEAAWAYTTGDSATILALIDTGLELGHPEFSGRVWVNVNDEDDGIDNDGNGFVDDVNGWDFVNNLGYPQDYHMHGTHVAGIAGAIGNNGVGIAGMNWRCRLMPVRVLDASGSGTFDNVAAGITYATNMGAQVINLSLGSSGNPAVVRTAIAYAIAAGVVVCAATGNDNVGTPFYPAAYDSVVSVGATDERDLRARGTLCPFTVVGSNYGPWIDVVAAGDNVWSTFPAINGSYGRYCLTSMASPHVAGLATLILALRPDYGADSVRRLIRLGAEDQVGSPDEDTPGFDIYYGWGRINGRKTLQALVKPFPPMLTVPGPQSVTEGDTLSFVVSAYDSNLTYPALSASPLVHGALTDHANGTGSYAYMPVSGDAGVHPVRFVAGDGTLADTGGVTITVLPGCTCPCHADPKCDGVTDVLDVVGVINAAFRGQPEQVDAGCPKSREDVDCNGVVDVLDVVKMVNVAFRGNDPATQFCQPCGM